MDERIEKLKSTTFGGKRFTRKQIAEIQHTVSMFSTLSLRELAHTICEHLRWHTPKGDHRIQACLGLLEKLQSLGLVSLPQKDLAKQQRGRQRPLRWTTHTEPPSAAVDEVLAQLTPLRLQLATDRAAVERWNEYLDRYHYLRYKHPIGPSLRYFIVDKHGRALGCLMFSYAAKALACRDEWIGWQGKTHNKQLQLVVNNNRFVIFPWVRVKCLASKALSLATRQLADDWHVCHGYRPVLVETFVDLTKFKATCYRAANWHNLGLTQGRVAHEPGKGKTQKGVYVYALHKDAKAILLGGHSAPTKTPNRLVARTVEPVTPADAFVQLWQGIIATLITVADEFDSQWQQRKRVLNSLLVMLFVFRLVFSNNKQGYAITIAELWAQCAAMQVPLPQASPVSASAMCTARAKLDENVFKQLHARILRHYDHSDVERQWNGHRIFAVDGSRINLPRRLIKHGYRTPSDNAHYPQGLLSCLYQLKSKIPVDFDLVAHGDERQLARTHLASLSQGDVVVYDRGYFSYAMIHAHAQRNIHPILRIKTKASSVTDAFIGGPSTDEVVTIAPTQAALHAHGQCRPIALRLVKYTVAGTTYVLGTTLLDRHTYSVEQLSDVYHSRWGIEELYKISKRLMSIEDFHGQTERGVKQELFAHFVLITLTRIFSNRSEEQFNALGAENEPSHIRANFKNCLITVARNIEGLLMQQATLLSDTINRIVASISSCRQKVRPTRSYARRSRKPIGKWKPPKAAKLKANELLISEH